MTIKKQKKLINSNIYLKKLILELMMACHVNYGILLTILVDWY